MLIHILLCIVILLSLASPLFAQSADATRNFLDGHRASFSTKDHPKAKGVNFTIAYPSSWAASEGERPNIVQKFVSEGGRGLEMAMIVTKQLPLPNGVVITEEDMREIFSLSGLQDMLPTGAVFVGAQSTEIEATPAGILEYSMRAERAGMAVLIHAWTLNFLYAQTLVQVQFQVAGSTQSEEEVARRMAAFKPLFISIANSIVFPDKWSAAPEIATGVSNPSASPIPLWHADAGVLLFVSFVITWGIGLTPPLMIRYVLLRRPLSKIVASSLAAGFSVFFWVAFLLAHAALGEKPGTGVVWVIIFFVSRWIMSREHVPAVASTAADTDGKSLKTTSVAGVAQRR